MKGHPRLRHVDTLVMMAMPANDETNRAYAARLGYGPGHPWPPHYANSVQNNCQQCKGVVWVGPHLVDKMQELDGLRVAYNLLCIFCAVIVMHAPNTSYAMAPLSSDRATEE